MTYICDERTTDGGVLNGNTFISITCADGGSFSRVTTCFLRNATTGSSLTGTVITREAVSRWMADCAHLVYGST